MPRADSSRRFRVPWARTLAPFVVLPPLVALGIALSAAGAPVANPHGKFREDCGLCHGDEAWKPAKIGRGFDHAKYGFALTGAHAAAGCTGCHASLDFTQERRLCASCHQDPHRGELGTDCHRCHSARSFIDPAGMVRAHQLTRFPLTGAHAGLDCDSCHPPAAQGRLQYVNTRAECDGCHLDDYRATRAPDHAAAGFPLDCRSCHSTTTWAGRAFDHSRTAFPLNGAHRPLACGSCHGDGVFQGRSAECVACHRPDYDGASPAHAAAGFSTACASCHNTTTWSGATFDHAGTAFPLTGAHRAASCASCHGNGIYAGTPTACVACHQADYNGTADPAHAAAGFSTACASCHNTTTWSGAVFDHAGTAFPLTGAHQAASCASCHGNGIYAGTPTACIACHRADYDGTSNPPHVAAGFGTDCTTCHGTTTWSGATFDHDGPYFPIYSGTHRGRWSACLDCHTTPTNYSNFSCLGCHPHDDRAETDGHHREVSGYAYDSAACYSCHPRGGN